MTAPFNAGLARQRRQFALAQRIAAVGIGGAGEHEVDRNPFGAQRTDRRHHIEQALQSVIRLDRREVSTVRPQFAEE